MKHTTILSFDVEEHYRIEVAAGITCSESQKDNYRDRACSATRRLLQLLSDTNCKATFFIVGELAVKCPDLVREIHDSGHEVASHGWDHRPATKLTPAEFREDVTKCKDALEQIIGAQVHGYRAPTFSIMKKTAWAIDELIEAGYTYDSSIFPVHHDRYGVPDAPTKPFRCFGQSTQVGIIEIPLLTLRMGFTNLPIGGGGYFRLFPLALLKTGIWLNRQEDQSVSMLYFHPWEFDPKQPELPLKRISRWRTYIGIERSEARLRQIVLQLRPVVRFTRVSNILFDLNTNPICKYKLH